MPPQSDLNDFLRTLIKLAKPFNQALKKTMKNTVQKDKQIIEAQIITEKPSIILDNIEILVPFLFQPIIKQGK